MLERFFHGAITDAYLDSLHERIAMNRYIDTDEISWSSYNSEIQHDVDWRGAQWFESIPRYRRDIATPQDCYCLVAHSFWMRDESNPRPKWWCPLEWTGRWIQLEPEHPGGGRYIWEMSPDGSFTLHGGSQLLIDDAELRPIGWAASHTSRWGDEIDILLILRHSLGLRCMTLREPRLQDDELHGSIMGQDVRLYRIE